jgi:hypothetical protein
MCLVFLQTISAQSIVVVNKDYAFKEQYEAVLVNAEGKVLRTMNKINKEDLSEYSEGVWVLRGKKKGQNVEFDYSNFINEKGEKLLAKDIEGFAWGFSDGWCMVSKTLQDGSQLNYFIDKTGKGVFKPIPNDMGKFYKGVTWKKGLQGSDDESLHGLINKKGDWILKPTYFEIRDFENGIAQVMVAMSSANGSSAQKYAYINTAGKLVKDPIIDKSFTTIGKLNEGVRMVGEKMEVNSFKEKIAFVAIDSSGKQLFNKKYYSSEIGDYITLSNMVYENGLCPTSDGYINIKGEVVISFPDQIIADATAFKNGLASFKMIPKNGDGLTFKYVVTNPKGKIVWQSVPNKLSAKFNIQNQYFSN